MKDEEVIKNTMLTWLAFFLAVTVFGAVIQQYVSRIDDISLVLASAGLAIIPAVTYYHSHS